jgi:putative acetyltransferase
LVSDDALRYSLRMIIREENPADVAAVREIVVDAFGKHQEAELIDMLRRDGDLVISLVAVDEARILGHLALSRLKSPLRALALAPLAVSKDVQRRGIGSMLVPKAIELARERDFNVVFVVGEPEYYARFGFSAESATPFPCPYAGPCFMALALTSAVTPTTPIVYAEAFEALR